MYNFPKKPAVGGIPARENNKIVNETAKKVFFFYNPENDFILSI